MLVVNSAEVTIVALKKELRRCLAPLKSSHLDESIANALGFRTYAALLSARRRSAKLPDFMQFDLERLRSRALALSGEHIQFDESRLVEASRIIQRTFKYIKEGDHRAESAWFRRSQNAGLPFIHVVKRRKYARLSWDCITLPADRDHRLRADPDCLLVRRLFDIFQSEAKGAPGKPFFDGQAFVGDIDNLLPQAAEKLADRYFLELTGALVPGSRKAS